MVRSRHIGWRTDRHPFYCTLCEDYRKRLVLKIRYPVVLDLRAEVASAFGSVQQIPANFLIAPDGSIVLHRLGAIDRRNLRPLIREMLKKESAGCG